MSFLPQLNLPDVPIYDPSQGDLGRQHVLYPSQFSEPETPQQLIAAGWMPCPRCGQSWISPENKAAIQASTGYYTCPKCKLTSDLMENIPWHGVQEEDYYPKGHTGGGTNIGLPMEDVGQIAENIIQKMHEIPGYGPIVWWHGSTLDHAALDGATAEWGIECKGLVYDTAGHFWDPGRDTPQDMEVTHKNQAAQEMGLKGILGVLVLENFRNDTADVYVKEMPLTPWTNAQGKPMAGGAIKWHKRTGQKVASGIPFDNPYKDPNSNAPGPYSLANYYQKPGPLMPEPPADPMPF